jgi:hypothetical protein
MDTTAAGVPLLDRLLEPLSRCIQGEGERTLLNLRAVLLLQNRINELARGCDEGLLSEAERDEYQTYLRFGNFIAILQAKARRHQNSSVAK